jgi:2-oxoglutarate dehydrogenase E2 component (dihydrolipoamide succinyltransferase)
MLRRKVAERLVPKNETAMLTTFNEVNMTPINLIVMNTKMRLKQNMVD